MHCNCGACQAETKGDIHLPAVEGKLMLEYELQIEDPTQAHPQSLRHGREVIHFDCRRTEFWPSEFFFHQFFLKENKNQRW